MAPIVKTVKLWETEAVGSSAVSTSNAVSLDAANALALHLTSITGDTPSVTFTYMLSADGVTYVTPQSPATIGATKAAVDVMDFAPECARFIKIVATNNNASNDVTFSAFLAIQENS